MIIFEHEIRGKEGNRQSCQLFVILYLYFIAFEYVTSDEDTYKKKSVLDFFSIEQRTI